MKRMTGTILLSMAMGLAAPSGVSSASPAQTRVIGYMGWENAYELSNGTARLVVVPELGGRIMEYSIDGRNIMWINKDTAGQVIRNYGEWTNYGGYKLWNAPQDRWGWPPDPAIDGGTCEVKVLEGGKGIKVIGERSEANGLRFIREIYMASEGSRVVVNQYMQSDDAQSLDWSVWDVTQVITPGMAALPTNPASPFAGGLRSFDKYAKPIMDKTVSIADNIAVITHNPGKSLKFGADSPVGWVAYTTGELLYIKRFRPPVQGEQYPDKGLNTEVYVSGDMGYVEVEILGPMTVLDKGGMASFNEEWHLSVPSEPLTTPDAFRKYLQAHPELLVWGNNR